MRHFIRHPTDIKFEFSFSDTHPTVTRNLSNISQEGLAFKAVECLSVGTAINIRIPLKESSFTAKGVVIWCRELDCVFEVGVEFKDYQIEDAILMVEQVTYIEQCKKINELNALIQVSMTINAHLDLDAVLESIMNVTTNILHIEASSLILIDNESNELVFHTACGEKAGKVKPIRMKFGEGIVGHVIQTGEAEIVNDVTQSPDFNKNIDDESGFKTKSILCVPLKTTNQLLGAIEVINKLDGSDFNLLDMNMCNAISAQAAIAIENAILHKQIVKTERLAAIGQTIAGLAHCIKNVLNGVQGGYYMVDLGLKKDDSTIMLKGWNIVKKNSTFLQDLVMDMLTYSKERKPEYELCDINDIVESVCSLMTPKATEKNIEISWNGNSSLNEIMLDPDGIKRCLLNLVSNALDACDQVERGKVNVTVDVLNESLFCISVSDNGCGITEKFRGKLFQLFHSTKGSKGTGLGLAVTYKIIIEHGGTIDVESEIGRGTNFIIKLPIRKN